MNHPGAHRPDPPPTTGRRSRYPAVGIGSYGLMCHAPPGGTKVRAQKPRIAPFRIGSSEVLTAGYPQGCPLVILEVEKDGPGDALNRNRPRSAAS